MEVALDDVMGDDGKADADEQRDHDEARGHGGLCTAIEGRGASEEYNRGPVGEVERVREAAANVHRQPMRESRVDGRRRSERCAVVRWAREPLRSQPACGGAADDD